MDKAVAISMKNHYLNYYRHFDHYRLEELDLKTIGSDVYKHINFLFFRNNSTLIITGDFGDAIFKWYSSENTLEDIAKYVKNDPCYFARKCIASSQPMYIYDSEKAKKDTLEWLDECDIDDRDFEESDIDSDLEPWQSADDFADEFSKCFDEKQGFTFDKVAPDPFIEINEDVLNTIDEDWGEAVYSIGRVLNPVVEVYAHALNLGFRWKNRGEKNGPKELE